MHESGYDQSILFRAFDEGEIFLPREKSGAGVKKPRERRIGNESISIINACDSFRAWFLPKIKLVESSQC